MEKTTHSPTEEQIQWLKENFSQYRNVDIAFRFNVTDKRVKDWLIQLGLKKEKKVFLGRKAIEKKEKQKIGDRQIKWLSGEYSNITREQHIDRILSMNI